MTSAYGVPDDVHRVLDLVRERLRKKGWQEPQIVAFLTHYAHCMDWSELVNVSTPFPCSLKQRSALIANFDAVRKVLFQIVEE